MYTELDDTQQNRKSKLWMSYRFDCTCEACRMPADGRELSDKRRLYIRNALRQLDSFDSDLSFEDLELAIKYAKSEGLAAYKSKLLLLGSSHIIKTAFTSRDKLGTYLKGRKMLEEAAAMSAMLEGTDSWTFQSIKLALDESFGPGMVPGR